MKRHIARFVTGAVVFSLLLGVSVTDVDAAKVSCKNKKNGRGSRNSCTIKIERSGKRGYKRVGRSNSTVIRNSVKQKANTGDNEARDSMKKVKISSGKVDQNIEITNLGGLDWLWDLLNMWPMP